MDETLTILAGILAALVLFDHGRRLYGESRDGRAPVFDALDMMLVIVALAALLTILGGQTLPWTE